jgi:uncharacterized protein (DUF885 family)
MQKLALVVTLAAVFASGSSARADHPLTKKYLDGLFKAKPHLATFAGDHRFDDKIVDLSKAALEAREKDLVQLSAQLAKSKGKTLDDQVDADIIRDAIALELLYLREIRDWEWDPRLYDSFPYYDPREIVAGRLSDIIHGTFLDEAKRRKSVVAQLKALPKYLEQEVAALERAAKHPAKVYVDQAITDNKGRLEFFESEVKAFVGQDKAGEMAHQNAVAALKKYQDYLEGTLAKRADGDWRLGAQLYAKKFPLALQTGLKPDDVVPRAEAAFAAAQGELYDVAVKLHKVFWPKEALASDRSAVIAKVKDELAKAHAKPDDLVASHAKNLDGLRAFIEKHDLLELPPKETLLVEPMPVFKRGAAGAEYLSPGALDRNPKWHATYYVDPVDPTWSADRVESYLRGQNDYQVQLVAAHEAYPGHHTQNFYAKRNPNALRAVLWNPAMAEGWAVYGEKLMVSLGWGGADNDRFRFFAARGDMVVATNILIDIKLQSGRMSDEEAVRFMVDEGFQEKAMAEKKLVRAKLDSTQLAQYFLGYDEIKTLETDYRKKVGDKWSQRTFDEALIGHGTISVQLLRRYLLDGKDGGDVRL